jgi:hypothetical protein
MLLDNLLHYRTGHHDFLTLAVDSKMNKINQKKRKKSERHLKEISLNSNQGIGKSSLSAELVIYSSLKNLSTAIAGTDQNTQSVKVFQKI